MTVIYSPTAVTDRLGGVITAIDDAGTGYLKLLAGGTVVSSIPLATPCGTAANQVLTFAVPVADLLAANTGVVTSARIEDGAGNVIISGLTAGIPLSGADIIISNGLNTTLVTAGQSVELLSGQIQGS